MKIELTDDTGQVHNVTEAVQIVYDAMHMGMEFGSGMLDTQEIRALRVLSTVAGWEPVEYGLDVCQQCGHHRQSHPRYGDKRCYARGAVRESPMVAKVANVNQWGQQTAGYHDELIPVGRPGPCGCSTFVLDEEAEIEP